MNYLFCSIFVLVSFFNFAAQAKPVGYRVVNRDKTIIQIARDIYNDQSKWPKIAKWNNIQAPYTIHKGQVLVLLDAPVNAVPQASLVEDVKAPEQLAKPKVKAVSREIPKAEKNIVKSPRKIIQEGKDSVYIASTHAPTLSLVGLELYGNRKMAKLIAKWNGISEKDGLKKNQKLKLKLPPTMTAEDGGKKLLEVWKQVGNQREVARLTGQTYIPVAKVKTPNELPQKEQHEEKNEVEVAESKPAPTAVAEPAVNPVQAPAPVVNNNPVTKPKVIEDASMEETAAMLEQVQPVQAEVINQQNQQQRAPAAAVEPEKPEEEFKPKVIIERIPVKANEASLPNRFNAPVESLIKEEAKKEEEQTSFKTEVADAPPAEEVSPATKPAKEMTADQDPELAAQSAAPVQQVQTSPAPAAVVKPAEVKQQPTVVAPAAPQHPVKAEAVVDQTEQRLPAAAPIEDLRTDEYWLGGNAERIKKSLSNKLPQEKAK